MSIVEWIFSSLFVIWFILSILAQFDQKFIKFNSFGFIPNCRFFSPKPVNHDLRIYCRGMNKDIKSDWFPLYHFSKKWYDFIWNPGIRLDKSVSNLVDQLAIHKSEYDKLYISIPYLIILNKATQIVSKHGNFSRLEFIVTKHKGYEDSIRNCIFESKKHNVE